MSAAVNQNRSVKVDRAPLAWLLPLRCVVCGDPGAHGEDLCAGCRAALPWSSRACPRCALPMAHAGDCRACATASSPLDAVHAAFTYAFPLDVLLPRLKFRADFAAGRVLAGCLAERFAASPRPEALLPLPLHRTRLRRRGYDQALELARPLARALGLPLRTDLLRRRRATAAQTQLDAEARRRNLQGAFAVCATAPLPEHVALFDDVMTTGATLHAAAAALRAAGVRRVEAWVCARVA